MTKQNKINFFGFSIDRWYRYSRNLTQTQKGDLIDCIVSFMEGDIPFCTDTVVLQRYYDIESDLTYVKERAMNTKQRNTENINKRWKKDTVV